MSNVEYVVMNENTLGYIDAMQPESMGVLQGSVLLGGCDPRNGPVSIAGNTIRMATKADFDNYRVASTGHLS